MKKRLYFICLTISLISCRDRLENDTKLNDSNLDGITFRANIKDEELISSIQDYIHSYDLDPKDCYLRLEIVGNSARKTVLISNGTDQITKRSNLPTTYTFIDEFLTLIYSNIDFLSDSDVSRFEFYNDLIVRSEISLDTLGYIKHPYTWSLSKCNDSEYTLSKQIFSGLKFYELPCGYILKRGKVKYDSIWVEREN